MTGSELDGAGGHSHQLPPSLSASLLPEELVLSNWDRPSLLSLSDSIRASLRHDLGFGLAGEKLGKFLCAVLRVEEKSCQSISFDLIEIARLDKLLDDVLRFSESLKAASGPDDLPLRFRMDITRCEKLQSFWRQRFSERYSMLDQIRYAALLKGGRLKDVSYNSDLSYDLEKWQTRETDAVSEAEGNLQFDAGHWWLNIICAQRDGIVTSPHEKPTSGRYGITTLPLLTGAEEILHQDGTHVVRYIREGRASDMHTPLISQVGQQIRLLRGYRLKSVFAPEAGLRYDGLYTIVQYGRKLDVLTNVYKLSLKLERVKEQKRMPLVTSIPTPSQLDDWSMYQKLEGDKIKFAEGNASYLEWKQKRETETLEREAWKRVLIADLPSP